MHALLFTPRMKAPSSMLFTAIGHYSIVDLVVFLDSWLLVMLHEYNGRRAAGQVSLRYAWYHKGARPCYRVVVDISGNR